MITEYRPVTWTAGEPLASSKLATMAGNDQYLFEAMPRLVFNNHGFKKDRGVKVLALSAVIPPSSASWGRTNVYFGDFFSVGCRPVVAAATNAPPGGDQYSVNIRGIGTSIPDHRGVEVTINNQGHVESTKKIIGTVYVPLVVVGF
jgi:hypothetical protein